MNPRLCLSKIFGLWSNVIGFTSGNLDLACYSWLYPGITPWKGNNFFCYYFISVSFWPHSSVREGRRESHPQEREEEVEEKRQFWSPRADEVWCGAPAETTQNSTDKISREVRCFEYGSFLYWYGWDITFMRRCRCGVRISCRLSERCFSTLT